MLVLALTLLWACASASEPVHVEPAPPNAAVELQLVQASGQPLPLSTLRGRPTLLFLFATYDSASQLAWAPLLRVHDEHPELQVIGIALQPGAEQLLDMYGASLGLSERPLLTLAFDPENAILEGRSALGSVTTIPGYVLIGADGQPLAYHWGTANTAELRTWLARHQPG